MHTKQETDCQIVLPSLCNKEMGQAIILICAIIVIHTNKQTLGIASAMHCVIAQGLFA